MARDSMQPWMDRVSFGALEVAGISPRVMLGACDWDGTDFVSRAQGGSVTPDLPSTASAEVKDDTAWGLDDFDFTIASY